MSVVVMVFVNGDFERAYPCGEKWNAQTFGDGLSVGAGLFGGDGMFYTFYPHEAWSESCRKDAASDYLECVPDANERALAELAAACALVSKRSQGRVLDAAERQGPAK